MECDNSKETNSPGQSYYLDLYKYNNIFNNQLDRRNKLLADLKKRRSDQIDELRGISDIFNNSALEEEPLDAVSHEKRKHTNYGLKFMLSEWLTEVPVDLESKWLFKICPVGIRNIIVANKGITKAYNRRNQLKAVFSSNLPGGSQHTNGRNFTLLDCIYRGKTYYVLDVLVWNSYSLLKCSTDFRFFFLRSKLLEDPELVSPSSNIKFINIDYHEALLPTIETHLMDSYIVNQIELPVDGILFYHKDCIYMYGHTPLVGWLKPYMVPEKLQIPINEIYVMKKPKNYVDLETYLKYIEVKYNKLKCNSKQEAEINYMDVGPTEESETNMME